MLIYPNPATNNIIIELTGYEDAENVQIEIFNLSGQKITGVPLKTAQSFLKIDVSEIPKGVYVVHVRADEIGTTVSKIIVH